MVVAIVSEARTEPVVLRWSRSTGRFSDSPDVGFAEALKQLCEAARRADVALVAGDLELPGNWVELLSAAAEESAAGGATPFPGAPSPQGKESSPAPLHPRISHVRPECCLLRRMALDLVPDFQTAPTPAAVLADWSARVISAGVGLVLADELAVPFSDTFGDPTEREPGPLRRALARDRQGRRGTSVSIDARALGPRSGGTQSYTGALVLAVSALDGFTVRATVAHDASAETIGAFRDAGVEVITYEQAIAGVPPSDVLHVPHQIFGAGDLNLARLLSDRLVITHLDLIAFHNPTYHPSEQAWLEHRRMTRIGMTTADRVIFTSPHARADALAEELLEPERAVIAGIGVDPIPQDVPRAQPTSVPASSPFLLVLGADYAHKNRPFALALFRVLRDEHGFSGRLVLAGRHMDHGGSGGHEQALLADDPALAAQVTDLGAVSEAEKVWLLENAVALLCPSLYEGYGLTPLEAASVETPCIYAAVSAHADVLGDSTATIVPWDPQLSAIRAAPLLVAGAARDEHLRQLSAALARSSWETAAEQLGAAYEQALAGPYRAAAQIGFEHLDREELIDYLRDRHRLLESWIGHGLTLGGSGGLLSEPQQIGLMRVASRRRLNKLLLKPFEVLGRLASRRD